MVIRFSLAVAALSFAGALNAQPAGQAKPAQAPQQVSKADFTKNVDARFSAIDTNKDGNLSKDEVSAMQAKALADAAAAEQKQMEADFKKLDTNNDNSLSLAEFKAAAPPLRAKQTAEQLIAELDANKDGKISTAEYRAGPLANFDKADTDHNGFLTAQEVQASRR